MAADPFLGEIKIFSYDFPPRSWALCNGQLLPINQNQALFALMGTTYGGNGQTTFALPNLRGKIAMHIGNGHIQGEVGGEENHTLTISELPRHTHQANASSNPPDANTPAGNFWASKTGFSPYAQTANVAMSPTAIANVGGS